MYSLVEMIKSRTLITLAKFQQRQSPQLLLLFVALQLLIWRNTLVVAVNVERINPYEKISKIQLNGRWWMGGGGPNNRSHYATDAVQEMWLTQKLDHFLEEGGQTTNQSGSEVQWIMRYLVNREFYEPGGPMFIVVGGEWEIHPYLLSEGHFYDMARQHNAIMFYTEHRFYGKSWPKNSASLDALEYLNVRQSLEDLRYFIKYQKSSLRDLANSKVVLLGASYSGSMVTWFMKLYPNEANVAWASSAPLLAKMDFHVVAVNVERINPYEKMFKIQLNGRWWMGGGEPNNRSHYASDAVQEMWLTQKLDHFLEEGGQTTNQSGIEEQWMMRYLVNREFYEPGGPMFIVVGGEWEIQPYLLSEGHFYDMARQHNAIMFYTEHRFYGKSWPKDSAALEALEYLSVRQSLEDLRYFIKYQKSSQKDLANSKVVLLGASYSGSMVTWFMKLYPNEANVAWASSAPLLAKMDFHEFMTLTMDVIKHKGGAKCSEKLEKGFQDLHRIFLSSSASKELLYNLQMCSDFDVDNDLDISAFFNGLGNYVAAMAQLPRKFVTQFCQQFMEKDTTPTDALVQHIRDVFLPHSQDETKSHGHGQIWCLDLSYEGMKSLFSSENDDIFNGNRCWFYQTCNEFGWFATTTSNDVAARNVFGGQVALKFFRNLCQDVFQRSRITTPLSPNMPSADGLTLQELYSREWRTNHIFGGLTNISQNVIFTHGRLDPWRAVGMQHGRNVLLLEGYGHVEDLGSINLEDSVALNVAKLKVSAFINKALRES